ncbi:ankyrin repeat-containing protein At5g02620-like [Syzygium oleosum]|uniref:ankyrin repeat-containing protein At5g02620-like n=1 Tax=Syzygium oleosum TaxID=219896 RepID=UPI0024BA4FBE|nr:ankyrin repeat-containing protein At5g02620-like [Syzygium oleosum]
MHPKVYEAAKIGDYDYLMTIILGNGEDLFHQTTPKGNNILHVAAQYKQVNLIQHLLGHPSGSSLLWQGNYKGDTPLHVAAKVGSCEAVRVFVDLAKSLHWVVENGQVDACKELLRKQNFRKDTTLHSAVRGGHDLVVELLLDEDPQLCDNTNAADESPLYLAADRGLSRITELILSAFSSSSSYKGPKGLTALHAGISLSLTSWEKIMENRPEAIREGDEMGWNPLHYVAYLGKVEAVRLLLQHDTSVAYDLDKAGESALHLAAFQGCANVIDELVKSCPDACDITNTKGQTALHAAVIGGRVNVVKYILEMPNQGDIINEQDNDGNTALHLATLHKHYNIINMLARDKRVDRLAKNKDHLTALDIFWTHKEIGHGARTVHYLLKGSHGIPGFQGWFIEHGKKRLDKQYVQGQPSESITTGSNIANQDNFNLSKKSIMDVQLLVAALIAAVTFAMAFTVPGGYNNDGPDRGMAILAGRTDFEGFVIFNSLAFFCSIMAIIIHLESFTFSYRQEPKHIPIVGLCIEIALIEMLLAYWMGMTLVLDRHTERTWDGIIPYLASGCPLPFIFFNNFPDHEAHTWLRGSSPTRRYIRIFFVMCETRLFDCARLISGHWESY